MFVADRFQCPHCEREFWSASGDPVPVYCPFCGANPSASGNELLWYEQVAHIRPYPHTHHLTTDTTMTAAAAVMAAVMQEYIRAAEHFPTFHSAHEGWAVIREEVDELWEEVKKPPNAVDPDAMRREAIQAAAMGLRFVLDVCSGKGE